MNLFRQKISDTLYLSIRVSIQVSEFRNVTIHSLLFDYFLEVFILFILYCFLLFFLFQLCLLRSKILGPLLIIILTV